MAVKFQLSTYDWVYLFTLLLRNTVEGYGISQYKFLESRQRYQWDSCDNTINLVFPLKNLL